jgi:alkaline phosphatase
MLVAKKEGNTLVVVTADHETGGFALTQGSIETGAMIGKFNTKGHTATLVPVFSYGPYAALFSGIYENTAIFEKMKSIVK